MPMHYGGKLGEFLGAKLKLFWWHLWWHIELEHAEEY